MTTHPAHRKKTNENIVGFTILWWWTMVAEFGSERELCRLGEVGCWHLYRPSMKDGQRKLTQCECCCYSAVETFEIFKIHQFQLNKPNFPFETYYMYKRNNNNHTNIRTQPLLFRCLFHRLFIACDSAECRYNMLHCSVFAHPAAYQLMQQHQHQHQLIFYALFFRSSANTYLHLTYLYLVYIFFPLQLLHNFCCHFVVHSSIGIELRLK